MFKSGDYITNQTMNRLLESEKDAFYSMLTEAAPVKATNTHHTNDADIHHIVIEFEDGLGTLVTNNSELISYYAKNETTSEDVLRYLFGHILAILEECYTSR